MLKIYFFLVALELHNHCYGNFAVLTQYDSVNSSRIQSVSLNQISSQNLQIKHKFKTKLKPRIIKKLEHSIETNESPNGTQLRTRDGQHFLNQVLIGYQINNFQQLKETIQGSVQTRNQNANETTGLKNIVRIRRNKHWRPKRILLNTRTYRKEQDMKSFKIGWFKSYENIQNHVVSGCCTVTSNTISIRNSSTKPVHNFKAPDYLPPTDKTTSKAPKYLPPKDKKTSKAPKYLPPKDKTTSNAPEYLPPKDKTTSKAPEYLPPIDKTTSNAPEYLPLKDKTKSKAPEYLPPIDKTTSKAPENLPPNTEMKVPNVKSSTVTPPDERGDIPDEDITTITPVIVKLVPPYDAIERPDTPVLSVSSSSVTIPKTDTSESSILMEEKSLSTTTPFFGGIKNLPPGYTKWRDPGTPASELSGSLMPMPVPPETDDNDNVLTSTPTKTTKTPDHHKMDESCLPSNHFTGPVYLPPKDSNSTVSATPTSSPTKPAMTRPASPESDDDNYDALPTPSSKSATDIPDHQEGSHPPTSFTGSEFSPPEATIMPAVETMYDFYEPA